MSALRLFKRIKDKFTRKQLKKSSKLWEKEKKIDFYNVEPLEERMLLSASPIVELLNDSSDSDVIAQTESISINDQDNTNEDNTILDFANISSNNSVIQSLIVGNYELKGSGTANIDVFNENVVSPGYSPGIQNITNYSQESSGTLIMEIESNGNVAGLDYDQINASGNVSLDGILEIDLLNDFIPTLDSEYTIITGGNISGKFSEIKGLTGFYEDYYFDIEQTDTYVKLITKEIIQNEDFNLLLGEVDQYDELGEFLNADYFLTAPSSITFNDVNVQVGDFGISGDFAFQKTTNGMEIIGSNASLELSSSDQIIGIENASIGLIIDNQKIIMESTGDILFDIDGFNSVSVDNVYAKLNQTSESYSNTVITIDGASYTFSNVEASVKELSLSGLDTSFEDAILLNGNFSFSKSNDKLIALAESSKASTTVGEFNIGVNTANIAVIIDENGVVIDANGSLESNLGSDISLSATNVEFNFNNTDIDYAQTIDFGNIPAFDVSVSKNTQFVNVSNGILNVADFFISSGDFSFQRNSDTISLSDSTTVNVDMLTMGMLNVNAFAGVNPESDTDKIGFDLTGVDLALVLMTETQGDRKWTSLQASSETANFVGIEEFNVTASVMYVQINTAASDLTLADFKVQPLEINVGTESLIFEIDGSLGNLTEISGAVTLNISDFFLFDGEVAFSKSSTIVTLTNDSEVEVDVLSVGMNSASFFVGLDGNEIDKTGFNLTNANFAISLISEKSTPANSWMSLKATSSDASFEGIDDITIVAEDVSVEINRTTADNFIDFEKTLIEVKTSTSQSIQMDMEGEVTKLNANVDLELFDFFGINGGFAFEKSSETLKLDNGSEVEVDLLTLGANDVNAFAGLNYGKSDEIGFVLSGVNLALALMNEKNGNRKWTALTANTSSAIFSGIDDLTLKANDVEVFINKSSEDGRLVDFYSKNLLVTTSSSSSINLQMDGKSGEYLKLTGDLEIDVFNFFNVNGSFGIEKKIDEVTLDNGDIVDVDLLTIGGENIDAFVGMNSGSSDAIGINAQKTNFALAILSDRTENSNSLWTSLQATVGESSFVGIDDLTLSGTNLSVEINRSNDTRYVDYTKKSLEIAIGTNSTIDLTMDGSAKELTQISGNMDISVFNFFTVSGDFAMKKYTDYNITTTDGTSQTQIDEAEVLTLGGAGLDAFIGMNANTDSELGLNVSSVDFALALINNKENKEEKYTSLQATAKDISFVGVNDLTMSASDISLNINTSNNDKVIDYKAMNDNEDSFDVEIGTNQTFTIDMDGNKGELVQASGDLEINLFNFVGLEGGFAFEKSTKTVILNSNEEIEVDYISLGGSEVSAFAGLNYKDADQVGLSLGSMSFGLALMSDRKDNTRTFTSLQATADNASFVGIDDLTLSANNIELYVNQGIEVDEIPEEIIKENTILNVNIYNDTVGNIVISKDDVDSTISIDETKTSLILISELKTSFAALLETNETNVEVSGDRINGFTVEFVEDLSGINIDGFSIKTNALSASSNTSTIKDSEVGKNEITTLEISIPRVIENTIDTEIYSISSSNSGINEVQSIKFETPYDRGTYSLTNGIDTVNNIKFVGSQTLTNETNIKAALVTLYGGTSADYKVKFDLTSKNGHSYNITFQGNQASKDISSLVATANSDMGNIITSVKTEGSSAIGESQHFEITTEATGTYTLSLDYNNTTYTTSDLSFTSSFVQVQAALQAALSGIDNATVSVVSGTTTNSFDITFGGSLSSIDLPLLKITTNADVSEVNGSFEIGFNESDSFIVEYNTNMETLAENIKIALSQTNTIANINNITVTYDIDNSTTTSKIFLIESINDLEKQDINDNFWTNDTSLNLASTKLYFNEEGYSDVSEKQKVSIITDSQEYDFTLSFTYNEQTYTTSNISSELTVNEIQSIINEDIASEIADAQINVISYNGTDLELEFNGSLSGQDVNLLIATPTTKTEISDITVIQKGSTTIIEASEASAIVVDFKAMNEKEITTDDDFKVLTSTNEYFTLDMDGSLGEYLKLTGDLDIDVFGAVQLNGGFALEKYTKSDVLLSSGETVNTELLSFGIDDATGLVGYDQDTEDKTDDVGLVLEDVDLALVILSDKTVGSTKQWSSVQSTVGEVSFSGINDLEMNITNLNITMNNEASDGSVIDYLINEEDNSGTDLSATISNNNTIDFNIDGTKGDFVEVSGQAEIDLFGVVKVDGGFAVSKSANQDIYLAENGEENTSSIDAELMTIGLYQVDALVGYDQDTEDKTDDVGLVLEDVDLSIALFDEKNGSRSWTTVQANVGSASFDGIDDLTMKVTETNILINKQAIDGTVVNYKTSDTDTLGTQLAVAVGTDIDSNTVYVDFNIDGTKGDFLEVSGQAEIDLFGAVKVDGGFAVSKSANQSVEVYNTQSKTYSTVDTELLTIGLYQVDALAGYDQDTEDKTDDVGLSFSDINLAVAIFNEKAGDNRKWVSAQASGSAQLKGIDELTASINSSSILINKEINNSVIDYNKMSNSNNEFNVAVGTDDNGISQYVSFNMDGTKGELLEIAGNITLSVSDFVYVSGGFAFKTSGLQTTLNGKTSSINTNLMTFGLNNVSIFAGLNFGESDAMGIEATGVDLALSIITEDKTNGREWISLEAHADTAGFVENLDEFELSVSDVDFLLNLEAKDGSVVDFTKTDLTVKTGTSSDAEYTFTSSGKSLSVSGNLDLNINNFITIEGGFSYEKSQKQMKLDTGNDVTVDVLAFGASNVTAFAGLNKGESNQIGVNLENVTFGFALLDDVNSSKNWISLEAEATKASFDGIDGIIIEANEMKLKYNSVSANTSIDYENSTNKIKYGTKDFSMSSEVIEASGSIELKVFDFFSAEGTFSFVKSSQTLDLSDNTKDVNVDILTLAAFNVSAFAGLNGGSDNEVGFVLDNANFALSTISEVGGDKRIWTSLKADVGTVGFKGMDNFEVTGNNIEIEINEGALAGGETTVIDYSSKSLEILNELNSDEFITFDMDGQDGAYIDLSGILNLNLFGFYKSTDFYSIHQKLETLKLSTNEDINVVMMTFAKSNIDATVGIGSVGFDIEDVDFGLAVISDGTRAWASLKATAQSVDFNGIEGVDISTSALNVVVNTGAFGVSSSGITYDSSVSIDYSAKQLKISDDITLDKTITSEVFKAEGVFDVNLFNFFTLNGQFSFEKSTKTFELIDDTTTTADVLLLSATGVDAFAGLDINGNKIGFQLDGVDVAFGMFEDINNSANNWTTLRASAENASFLGVDGLTIDAISEADVPALDISLNITPENISAIDFSTLDLGLPQGSISFEDITEKNIMKIEGLLDINLFDLYSKKDNFSFTKEFQTVTYNDGSTGTVDILTLGAHIDSAFAGVNEDTSNEFGFSLEDAGFGLAFAMDTFNPSEYWVTGQVKATEAAFRGGSIFNMEAQDVEVIINTASSSGKVIDYSVNNLEINAGVSYNEISTSNDVAFVLDAEGIEKIGIDVGYAEFSINDYVQVVGGLSLQKGGDIVVDVSTNLTILDIPFLEDKIYDVLRDALSIQMDSSDVLDLLDSLSSPSAMIDYAIENFDVLDFSTIKDVTVSTLTIGASDVNVFAGFGPYFQDTNDDGRLTSDDVTSDDAMGFALENVNVAIGIFTAKGQQSYLNQFTSLKVTSEKVGVVGFDDFQLKAEDIEVNVNTSSTWSSLVDKSAVIDFESSYADTEDEGFKLQTGGDNFVILDFDGENRTSVEVGQAVLQIDEFLYLQGSFSFEKGATETVTINTGLGDIGAAAGLIPGVNSIIDDIINVGGLSINSDYSQLSGVEVSTMTIGASNVQAFAGIGGPYKQDFDWDTDEDGNGNTYDDFYYNTGATGLVIENLDFGMAIFDTQTPFLKEQLKNFYALNISADKIGLVGLSEDINSNGVLDNAVNIYYYDDNGTLVQKTTNEDADGNKSLDAIIVFEGIDISVSINNGDKWGGILGPATIDFETSFDSFTEDTNSNGIIDLGEDLNNDGIINEDAFVVNTGGEPVYIDYSQNIIEVDVGLAQIQVSEFLYLRGGFKFTMANVEEVVVNTGELASLVEVFKEETSSNDDLDDGQIKMNVDRLSLAATNLYGFAGVGGAPWIDLDNDGEITGDEEKWANDDSMGVTIVDADIALAIMTPSLAQLPGAAAFMPKFVSLKSSVDYAGLIGLDDYVEANLQDVQVNINTLYVPPAVLPGPLYLAYVGALAVGSLPNIDYEASYSGEDLNNNFILDEGEDLNNDGILNRGLEMSSGLNAFYLDFDEEIIEAKGYGELQLLGTLQVSAGFSISKKIEEVTFHDVLTGADGEGSTVSLSFAIVEGYGYIGEPIAGGYWLDENNDGQISDEDNGAKTSENVVGIEVEDLNLGMVFMRQTGIVQWEGISTTQSAGLNVIGATNLYAGITASLGNIELVGVPGVELRASDFEFNFNGSTNSLTGVSSLYVDFSKSGEVDENGVKGEYEISINEALTLNFGQLDSFMLSIIGEGLARVYDVNNPSIDYVSVSAALSLKVNEEGIELFFDGQVNIADGMIESHAIGLFVLNEKGLISQFSLDQHFAIDGVFELDAALEFRMNTLGYDYEYQVPDTLVDTVGYETLTVSATPPGKSAPVDAYISLSGEGNLELLDMVTLKGEFDVLIYLDDSELVTELNVAALLIIDGLSEIGAAGTLGISTEGIYGSLMVGNPFGGGSTIIDTEVFSISGGFLFQINTTSSTRSIKALEVDSGGSLTGNFITEDIEKQSLFLAGSANIEIVGAVTMYGSMQLLINEQGLQADANLVLELGDMGNLDIEGAISILNTEDEGPIFAMRVATNVELGISEVGIKAGAILEINTSDTTEYAGVQAGTLFNLELDGALKILAFDVEFKGSISVVDDIFEIRIDKANLNFFNFVDINISGYIRSDGNFLLTGSADFYLGLGPIELNAGISMTLGNKIFAASVYGSLDIHIDLGLFDINTTLAGFAGEIELTPSTAYLRASATVAGITVSGDKLWTWGIPDPILATNVNGVLYLNMGDRWEEREEDLNDPHYDDVTNEMYTITEEDNGDILVEALGFRQTYSGVTKIVGSGGSGNDSFFIDSSVTKDLQLDGGAGNDEFIILGGASGSKFYGGDGKDTFTNTLDRVYFYGGAGNDTFNGSDGIEYIDMGTGKNTINSSGGNDIITINSANDVVNAGKGDDTIYATFNAGNLNLIAGEGNDKIIFASSNLDGINVVLGDYSLSYNYKTVSFDETLEEIFISDTNTDRTILKTDNQDYTNTSLIVESNAIIDIKSATLFNMSDASLVLDGYGIDGTINSTLKDITVINKSTDVAYSNITINETDSLNIVDDNREDGGLYTNLGAISITLGKKESLLHLKTGVISTSNSGRNITIKADDIEFDSGSNKVTSLGLLDISTKSLDQNYRIGGAGNSVYGNDYSLGADNGYLNFSMKDFDALSDGFSHIYMGHQTTDTLMMIGDLEDKETFPNRIYNAKLNDLITFTADRINIVGDVQSSTDIYFESKLFDIQKTNINAPLSSADAGIDAESIYITADEQMIVSGWLRASDLIDINILQTQTGNTLVGYGDEINSFTADVGSTIFTTNDNAIININTNGSIYSATGIEVKGTNSTINMVSSAGLNILEGGVVAARYDNSTINLLGEEYLHINSGAAVTSGAYFEYEEDTPVAIKSGINSTMNLSTSGELLLAGAITSSGAMNLTGGGSFSDYEQYFDNILGTQLASTTWNDTIKDALNNNTLDSTLVDLFSENKLTLGANVTLTALDNYKSFSDLDETTQNMIIDDLGYEIIDFDGEKFYFNAEATTPVIEKFIEGDIYTASELLSMGYIKSDKTIFYNPETNQLQTSFLEGESVDYSNSMIDWVMMLHLMS